MQIKPILRIFDLSKALEFYIDWLEFKLDWQHQFEIDSPFYLQVSFAGVAIHLSEHHGDGTPGTYVHIEEVENIRDYHARLLAKNYKYNRPGLEVPFWNDTLLHFVAYDPFGNRIIFSGTGAAQSED